MTKRKVDKAALVPEIVSKVDVCLAYKEMAGTPAGQIVLMDLTRRFGYTRYTTFDERVSHKINFNEGQRSVLIHVGEQIEMDPASLDEPTVELGEEPHDASTDF